MQNDRTFWKIAEQMQRFARQKRQDHVRSTKTDRGQMNPYTGSENVMEGLWDARGICSNRYSPAPGGRGERGDGGARMDMWWRYSAAIRAGAYPHDPLRSREAEPFDGKFAKGSPIGRPSVPINTLERVRIHSLPAEPRLSVDGPAGAGKPRARSG